MELSDTNLTDGSDVPYRNHMLSPIESENGVGEADELPALNIGDTLPSLGGSL